MRQRFVYNVGGTLRFRPPECDAADTEPTSGTVTIKRATDGADLPTPIVDAAATVDGSDLTVALSAGNCPDPLTSGVLYRAVWAYVVDGKSYQGDQLYEVRRRVLKPTLTIAELVRRLPASLAELDPDADPVDAIGDAWDDVLDDLAEKGYEPDRVLDVDRLRRPHRSKTIANMAKGWGPSWKEWAIEREKEYRQDLDAALAGVGWYDADDSLTKAEDERKIPTVRLTR
jgi:hypothetical protein